MLLNYSEANKSRATKETIVLLQWYNSFLRKRNFYLVSLLGPLLESLMVDAWVIKHKQTCHPVKLWAGINMLWIKRQHMHITHSSLPGSTQAAMETLKLMTRRGSSLIPLDWHIHYILSVLDMSREEISTLNV